MLSNASSHMSRLFMMSLSSGKVAVKKEDLQKYHGKDHWFPLHSVSADSEVQVHILCLSLCVVYSRGKSIANLICKFNQHF